MKIADLFIKLGLKSKEFEQGIDKAKKKTNMFGDGMKKIGGMIAGVFAVQRIASFTAELAKLGGEAEGVRAAFNRIADDNVLRDLERATANTVSKMDLMKQTISAQNLGIPVENLARLFEFAAKRAQDTGQSADYLVQSIALGIGRKSIPILDNLGITSTQLRDKFNQLGLAGNSVGDYAKAAAAIADESLKQTGGIIDTNATKIQNLKKQWEDLKLEIATSNETINFFGESLKEVDALSTIFLSNSVSGFGKMKALLFSSREDFFKLAEEIRKTAEAEKRRNDAFKDASKYEDNEFRNKIKNEQDLQYSKQNHIKTIGELKDELNQLNLSIDSYNENQVNDIQNTLKEIAALEELIKKLTTLKTVRDTTPMSLMQTKTTTPKIGEYPTPFEGGLMDMTGFLEKNAKLTKQYTQEMLADWNNFNQQLSMVVEDGIAESISVVAESLGQLASGQINLQGFFNNILSQLGNFLKTVGKMFILYGVAQLEFFKSLAQGPVGAIKLIAAGAALVAIGGAIGGLASNAAKGNIGGGSSTYNIKSTDRNDVELVAKVSGRDLEFVLAKRGNYTSRT